MPPSRPDDPGSLPSAPSSAKSPTTPMLGTLHFELFTGKRYDNEIRVPCRCSIGSVHTHEEWLAAGSPPISGKPRRKRKKPELQPEAKPERELEPDSGVNPGT
ncbi:hypothetical protein [Plantibacter sp. YIM 135347]|uniref:hypothetical protein n=1 Tax=Plantibacter sp. YIM 135347 TaxID=3423919 RepID=UPI003D33E851